MLGEHEISLKQERVQGSKYAFKTNANTYNAEKLMFFTKKGNPFSGWGKKVLFCGYRTTEEKNGRRLQNKENRQL